MTDPREPLVVVRSFDVEIGDGRTIVGRAVPYDQPTEVMDPTGDRYLEVWRRGAFRNVVKDPGRTRFVWAHDETVITNQLGRAVSMEEDPDGLTITLRADQDASGEKALSMIAAGTTGLSVRAVLARGGTRIGPDGIVERRLVAQLPHVALTPAAQYEDAKVLAVRSGEVDRVPPGIAAMRDLLDGLRLHSGQ